MILRCFALFCFSAIALAQSPTPDVSQVRDNYTFTWAYELAIELNGQKLEMVYHIEPGATYYGQSMKYIPGVISITDLENHLEFKTLGKSATLKAIEDKRKKMPANNRHRYTRLPDKNILGYTCIGVKAESDTEVAILYFTNEAETSYPELYEKLSVHHYVLGVASYGFSDKSLLISSDVTRKKDGGHASITCLGLEKQPILIRKADYHWKY